MGKINIVVSEQKWYCPNRIVIRIGKIYILLIFAIVTFLDVILHFIRLMTLIIPNLSKLEANDLCGLLDEV